jgi:hypothetical protein
MVSINTNYNYVHQSAIGLDEALRLAIRTKQAQERMADIAEIPDNVHPVYKPNPQNRGVAQHYHQTGRLFDELA